MNNRNNLFLTHQLALLYGDLKGKMHMECCQGMNNTEKDDCIGLDKWIYDTVQAKEQYYTGLWKFEKGRTQ